MKLSRKQAPHFPNSTSIMQCLIYTRAQYAYTHAYMIARITHKCAMCTTAPCDVLSPLCVYICTCMQTYMYTQKAEHLTEGDCSRKTYIRECMSVISGRRPHQDRNLVVKHLQCIFPSVVSYVYRRHLHTYINICTCMCI